MRNMTEHPMTYEECIRILSDIANDLDQQELIGDIRPYAIDWAIEKLINLNIIEKMHNA